MSDVGTSLNFLKWCHVLQRKGVVDSTALFDRLDSIDSCF